jgi:hypothetical protein
MLLLLLLLLRPLMLCPPTLPLPWQFDWEAHVMQCKEAVEQVPSQTLRTQTESAVLYLRNNQRHERFQPTSGASTPALTEALCRRLPSLRERSCCCRLRPLLTANRETSDARMPQKQQQELGQEQEQGIEKGEREKKSDGN